MAIKSEVSINFDTAELTWGLDDGMPPVELVLTIRDVKIKVYLYGQHRTEKSRVIATLRRSLKPFVRGGRICNAIDFNTQIKLFLVHYAPNQIGEWQHEHPWDDVGSYRYGVWFNLEAATEMLIRDESHVTSLVSDDLELDVQGLPACIEFVRSEGGVLFIPHRLGLDSLTSHAVVGQRIRRELWRRTRGGSNFSDYGNFSTRENPENPQIEDVWLGENHIWSIDRKNPHDIIPNVDYFTAWGIDYVLDIRTARKRLAEFTFNQPLPF